MDWQPIETADTPKKTGERILLGAHGLVCERWWARDENRLFDGPGPKEGWAIDHNAEFNEHIFVDWPTHWMPLPAPPAT